MNADDLDLGVHVVDASLVRDHVVLEVDLERGDLNLVLLADVASYSVQNCLSLSLLYRNKTKIDEIIQTLKKNPENVKFEFY